MLHAIIMAGGAGTRFWPASRQSWPKQLLTLLGERSMIQLTLDRLAGLVPPQRTLVITNTALAGAIAEQLPELPAAAIVGEPCKRDTAPCIGLAAFLVSRQDPDATMVVLPSDHVIRPEESFRDALQLAAELVAGAKEGVAGAKQRGTSRAAPADSTPSCIVTFGIRPTYPAETFGYIQRGESFGQAGASPPVFRVQQFREKPKAHIAREYLASGDYYWNSGIFVWKARTILDALAEHQPEMYEHLKQIDNAWETPERQAVLEREYASIRGISVDYAVMEHARDVLVIEAPFEWDDLGNWQSLARLRGADAEGNTIAAKHLGLNTSGCIIRGTGDHLIVTLGLKDCIVVQTPDATLVANKHDEEAIRQVVKLLEERGWKEYL
jgi:mannose-1-phosphate guanylyltransferase